RRPQLIRDLAVYQHEYHPHRTVRAVCPGVVGPALNDRVAFAYARLGTVVEQQPCLALEHDTDVKRLSAVHWRLGAGRHLREADDDPACRRWGSHRPIGRLWLSG